MIIQKKLIIGSDFEDNKHILSEYGWLQIFGEDKCDSGISNEKEFVYVKGRDPTYSLNLKYNSLCKLDDVSIKRRNNEL